MSLFRKCLVMCAILVSLLGSLMAPAFAQQPAATYDQYPPKDPWTSDPKAVKALQTEVTRILRNASSLDDASRARLDQWYKNYFFRLFTTQEYWGKLEEFRTQLIDRDLRGAKNKPAADYVTTLTLQLMQRFAATPQLHPAVRYNAILIIGDLNAEERGARGADGRQIAAPDPLPAALNVLIAEYTSPTQIDAVRLGALLGILRHAKLDLARPANRRIPQATRQALVNEMLTLVKSPPPANRTPEGHVWMQRRGIEVLGALEAVGQEPTVSASLESIVADDQAPMSLRLTAAETLGRWVPAGKVPVNVAAVGPRLGSLAGVAFYQTLESLKDQKKQQELQEQIRTLLAAANMGFPTMSTYGSESEYGSEGGYPGGSSDASYSAAMMESMSGYGSYGMESGAIDMESMMSSMYGGYGMGGYGMGMMAKPADPVVDRARRRLKSQLVSIKAGLDGLAKTQQINQNAAEKAALAKIQEAVDACLAATDPPPDKVDLDGFTKWIEDNIKKLAAIMPKEALAAVNAKPAAPAAAPGAVAAPAAAPGAVAAPAAASGPPAAAAGASDPFAAGPGAAPPPPPGAAAPPGAPAGPVAAPPGAPRAPAATAPPGVSP